MVVAVQVFVWMTDFQSGILNHALAQVGITSEQHDWYATPTSKLAMVTALIVWGAIPFVTITVYAGLAQVPHERPGQAQAFERESQVAQRHAELEQRAAPPGPQHVCGRVHVRSRRKGGW